MFECCVLFWLCILLHVCHSLSVFSAENSKEEEKEEDRSKFAMFECTCLHALLCTALSQWMSSCLSSEHSALYF